MSKLLPSHTKKDLAFAEKQLTDRGAIRFHERWLLPTPVGVLEVTIHETWIACWFTNANLARVAFDPEIAPNGEWNFHDWAWRDLLLTFAVSLERLFQCEPSYDDLLAAAKLEAMGRDYHQGSRALGSVRGITPLGRTIPGNLQTVV